MKLALEALEAGEYYIDDLEAIVYASDDLGTHEDRAKMQAAITALREALAEQSNLKQVIELYDSPDQPAQQNIRNATLDEIADKIALMPFGDTAASFAVWIKEQKT